MIDKLTKLELTATSLIISREDQEYKLYDCLIKEWYSRIEMVASLTL